MRNRIKLGRSAPSKLEQSWQDNDEIAEKEERDYLSFEKGSEDIEKSVSPRTPKKRF